MHLIQMNDTQHVAHQPANGFYVAQQQELIIIKINIFLWNGVKYCIINNNGLTFVIIVYMIILCL